MEPQPYRMQPQNYVPYKMVTQRRRPSKKSWDREMRELFCQFTPTSPSVVITFSENQPRLYKIWDISQKFLLLMNNILVAGPKTSNSPEQLISVLPNITLDPKRQPIFMGLSDATQTLSCVKSNDGPPHLQLVKENIVELYKKKEPSLSSTFFSRTSGNQETCCFESAAFPGWFISTSTEPNRPIHLSREGGADINVFYFERKQ
ncbi:interleukin-1 family member 10-like [Elgaria multicarinata webbii]|uniref:interleukin-1 family member 10-like n=1 Tax=Elgaria multicarinata webbii TaxID=159646 RepID=UPI002FCCE46D